ncbi:hypothetical protein FACS189451_12750 [Bacteroidia bacterium]|nr:hypothetical protein FACS189451_12750 [Bacteroidia bacterium]
MIAAEPAVAYQRTEPIAKAVDWNPNYPVQATQEEWWEHIHQIEQGKFYTAEEYERIWEKHKREILANLMK